MSRRDLIRGLGAALSMALAGCTSIPETHRVAASDLAREYGSVDLHAHPGMFRITHIERMVEVVGVDHVGVGTDMDGISPPSFLAYDDYGDWPSIGAALLARGRSRDDVVKVLGGNFRRVFEDVTAA